MSVIHVPPKVCPRCSESHAMAIVPPTETMQTGTRVPEQQRGLVIPFPFLPLLEQADRPPDADTGPSP